MAASQLTTDRFRLRQFKLVDADISAVQRMRGDPQAKAVFASIVAEPDFAEPWVRRNEARYRIDGFGLWALERLDTGEFVGDCRLTLQKLDDPDQEGGQRLLEVGYHLTLESRGQGYATEAARAGVRYPFDTLGAPRVHSIVHRDNEPSHRVAGRIHDHSRSGLTRGDAPVVLYWTDRDPADDHSA